MSLSHRMIRDSTLGRGSPAGRAGTTRSPTFLLNRFSGFIPTTYSTFPDKLHGDSIGTVSSCYRESPFLCHSFSVTALDPRCHKNPTIMSQ